jgi:hypothetical protein
MANPPFALELDLSILYVPPMSSHGRGITLTRRVELPFPPYDGLAIHSKQLDYCQEPLGFRLTDVVWDMDRQVFVATTSMESQMPLAEIGEDIASWQLLGWKVGSYLDPYTSAADREDEDLTETLDADSLAAAEVEEEARENLPALPARRRPKAFNRLFRALVRKMAELHNNSAVAYAMWKTQRYFDEEARKECASPAVKAFEAAVRAFDDLSSDEQFEWVERLKRRYPRLDRVAEG